MIWRNKKFANIQQIAISHSDICDVILQTDDRDLFLISVYVLFSTNNRLADDTQLEERINLLHNAFLHEQLAKPHLELILTGDFNRWDTLWGGNNIASYSRQDEGQILINLMAELDLQLLLPQGTITYSGATSLGNAAFTIDLVFSGTRLAEDRILYTTLDTNHGSNHAAIQTVFSMNISELPVITPHQLFKFAPWNKILQMVSEKLYWISASPMNIDIYANQLLQIVQSVIEEHVLLAKPSLYAKQCWCKDVTALRKEYTNLKNRFHRAKRHNLGGNIISTVDAQVSAAKHAYFKALRKRKKSIGKIF